ncbi:DUF1211 domain-containing protein [Patescibacteria group bacterium]|nr:DUF1211 domain-containing protein [Patescibacteria group bacterium]
MEEAKKEKEKLTLERFLSKENAWLLDEKNTDRIITFSDAVFAIAITIIILQIEIPLNIPGTELKNEVVNLWPQILSYLISFAVIGRFWFTHLRLGSYVKHFDKGFIFLNMLFLLSVTFLPFPTDLYGSHSMSAFSLVFYCAAIGAVALISSIMWFYAYRHPKLLHEHVDKKILSYSGRQALLVTITFAIGIIVIVAVPELTPYFWFGYIAIDLITSNISRSYEKRKITQA